MSELPLDHCLAVATRVAEEAGALVMHHYQRESTVHTKGGDARNLVTDADLASEAAIAQALHAAFPTHALLSEEGYRPGQQIDPTVPTWVVDPIDGTSNFAHRLPLFSISIGLTFEGQGQVGVIHAPALGWRFAARRGGGATLGSAPIQASQRTALHEAIVACDWSRQPALRRRVLATFSALGEQVHTLRSLGSAALGFAAVAAGWADGYFNFALAPWDTVAGALIVQEAGGRVTALDGSPWRAESAAVLVSNGSLHGAALAVIAPFLHEEPR